MDSLDTYLGAIHDARSCVREREKERESPVDPCIQYHVHSGVKLIIESDSVCSASDCYYFSGTLTRLNKSKFLYNDTQS